MTPQPLPNPTPQQPQPPQQKPLPKKRRWITRLLGLLLLCAVLVGLLPHLASSMPGVRNFLLARAVPDLNGSITAEGASLEWNQPIAFHNVSIRSADDMPVVDLESLRGNRPLWKLLLKPSVLGTYRLEKPSLTIVTYPDGSTNLSEVFTGMDRKTTDPTRPRKVPNRSVAVEMIEGRVMACDQLAENTWVAEPIQFAFRIVPSSATSDGRTRLEIPAQKVFDQIEVTPQVCHGLLKYITPVLADAIRTEGTFSIEVQPWSLPLDSPREGSGKGVFTVHKLSVEAGSILQKVLLALRIQDQLVSVEETPITFELVDGRMRHEGMEFYVGRIQFTSSGSVGLEDKSLDLNLVLQLPQDIKIDRPFLQALAGQSITIPIRGTLDKPEVDLRKLSQTGIETLLKTLDRLQPREE